MLRLLHTRTLEVFVSKMRGQENVQLLVRVMGMHLKLAASETSGSMTQISIITAKEQVCVVCNVESHSLQLHAKSFKCECIRAVKILSCVASHESMC